MSDEKKTEQSAENEKTQQGGDPFARDHKGETAEEAAAQAETQAQTEDMNGASLQERIQELEERLKRAVAEQENLRKRMEREKADVAKYAMANFARDVLGIADNIQRAIHAVPKDAAEKDTALKTFLEGIEVTERELHKAMERHGITKLNPEGEKFDPNYHQAMFEIPTSDTPSGVVMQVVQPGYLLADRVLRPAMVGVSKAAPANDDVKEPERQGAANGSEESASKDEPQAGGTEAGKSSASPENATSGASAEKTAEPSGKDEKTAQPRSSSRLNEPVINGETEKDFETESATRKT